MSIRELGIAALLSTAEIFAPAVTLAGQNSGKVNVTGGSSSIAGAGFDTRETHQGTVVDVRATVFTDTDWKVEVMCDGGIPVEPVGELETLAGGSFPGPTVSGETISGRGPKDNGDYEQAFISQGNCIVVFGQ